MARSGRFALLLGVALFVPLYLHGQVSRPVTFDRLVQAAQEPQNWLTYAGSYSSTRYSGLDQITAANARNLELKWAYQGAVMGAWQTSPLVVDGVMYLTQRPNDVVALDARTGRVFWIYQYPVDPNHKGCCGANNRGVAILGDTLFMGTLDAHLIAIDAKNGRPLWKTRVAEMKSAYSLTLAPLVVKDKVIVGTGGGDRGIRGFIAAYDAKTGKEVWRFYTVPGPGEPGHETWRGDTWKSGGGSIWLTGSYDPSVNLTYWGVGNPGPDWNPDQRPGDNLYTDSVVALDADTGKLRWHFQFTPNDAYDYDSVQTPVLVDAPVGGTPRKLMLWANRNGFFYVLDRTDGKFLLGRPFVKVNWASIELDTNGRPLQTPQPPGMPTWPGNQGGTNWYSPSFSPRTGLLYVSAWEDYASIYRKQHQEHVDGQPFHGGGFDAHVPVPGAPGMPGLLRGPINNWTEAAGHGAVLALEMKTGERKWKFNMTDVTVAGILTTAGDVLFTGTRDGYVITLDARTGALLYKLNLGSQVVSAPITYQVNGRQYVSVISGMSLSTFALRD
jgi:alcohol dehydrogenase (cytochrome c)